MLDYVYSPCAVPQNDFGGRATWGATFGGYAVSILSLINLLLGSIC